MFEMRKQSQQVEAIRTAYKDKLSSGPQATVVLSSVEIEMLCIAIGRLSEMMDDSMLDGPKQAHRIVLSLLAEKLGTAHNTIM